MVASRISFGKIEFDDIHGQLLCEGKPIAISQRASALLGALIQANGQAVSKTELMFTSAVRPMSMRSLPISVSATFLKAVYGAAGTDYG